MQASAVQRQQIVRLWKQFGYTATVTEKAGKTVTVYDVYLDFFPPSGGIFLESVPARTNLPILLTTGGADVETGTLIPPTNRPAIPHLMGITDHYQPESASVYDFSVPLRKYGRFVFRATETGRGSDCQIRLKLFPSGREGIPHPSLIRSGYRSH